MKISIFSYLALFLAILAFDQWLKTVGVRIDGPARHAAVRFVPVEFDPAGFAPLKLGGAWNVQVDDRRFGGVSGLAMDSEALVAITDSGSVIRLPQPGRGTRALVQDLPAGPGNPQFKINRDSEAIVRDPAGRGWWVAFEQWHQLWLYDPGFTRALAAVDLGERRWHPNRGVEAMVADGDRMLLFPEPGDEWLRLAGNWMQSRRLAGSPGAVADAVGLPGGPILIVTRELGLGGLDKHLVEVSEEDGELRLRRLAALRLRARDNVEALAAQRRADGGTRLWLMTDNDFRPRKATLLVALDLP